MCSTYCGACGERVTVREDCWFAVYLEGGTRRSDAELSRLSRFPGRTEQMHGATVALIDSPEQISWLVERVPGLLASKSVHLVTPSGSRIRPDDPVYSCLLGTRASGIRGCMTQLTRPALCGLEATLLPLREKMKTHSLSDRLESAGQFFEAAVLTLGVIAGLEKRGEKISCPLFGRALRWSSTDAADLPLALGKVKAMRARGPFAQAGSDSQSGRGKRVSRLPGLVELDSPVRGPGRKAPPHSVRSGASVVLCTLGRSGKAQNPPPAWLFAQGRAEAFDQPPPFLFGHATAGAAVLGYRRFPDLLTVEMVRSGAKGVMREIVPAADVDCAVGIAAALEVNGNQIRIAVAPSSGEDPRLFIWRGARLSAVWWRLTILAPDMFVVWNALGAAYLLTKKGGWLLSPAAGVGRYRSHTTMAPEFQGVRSLARTGKGTVAVLSAHGHLLTTVAPGPAPGPGAPPLTVIRERVLPFASPGMTESGTGELLAVDSHTLYTINAGDLAIRHVLPLAAGRSVALVAGGGYVVTEGREANFYLPLHDVGERKDEDCGEQVQAAAERLGGRGGEPVLIVDRHGRPPTRANWGA